MNLFFTKDSFRKKKTKNACVQCEKRAPRVIGTPEKSETREGERERGRKGKKLSMDWTPNSIVLMAPMQNIRTLEQKNQRIREEKETERER